MEEVVLKYGQGQVTIPVDGAASLDYLYETPMAEIPDLKAAFLKSVTTDVIGSAPLCELVTPQDPITIVISDMTRFWMRQDLVCEQLVRYLHETLGIPFENLVVLVAVGTHRGHSQEELAKLSSQYVFDHVKVVDHSADAPDLVAIGTTSLGTVVEVNPLAIGRKVICVGGTVHHIMAGYGGGRKSIVPGIASRETIKQNHQRALDPSAPQSDPTVGSGKLGKNPIHEDMYEAGALAQVTFGINIVVTSSGKHSGLFSGDFDKAWRKSCHYVQTSYGLPIAKEADIVIASCGGFPKDLNLYQSTKSMFNATQAVKKGGTLIWLAQCPEGSGASDFFAWNKPLQEGHLDESLRKDFTIGGYIFYAAVENIAKANTLLLSDIDPQEVKAMGITAYDDITALLSQVDFAGKSVYVLPYGGSVMPQLQEKYDALCAEFV
ncbi:nickel-dependent lactate racemase [Bengtsoniella intestinalis]|uniref:nickel-dependent lactate racemase n=1 Tax=Bengtsoniella intestinalis TaxID=3073143 RepID=UPI00391F047B